MTDAIREEAAEHRADQADEQPRATDELDVVGVVPAELLREQSGCERRDHAARDVDDQHEHAADHGRAHGAIAADER